MVAWLSHKGRSRSKVLVGVLCALVVMAYFANRPAPPVVAAPDIFVPDPTTEFVTFPAPIRKIPGDRGDIRVARGPVRSADEPSERDQSVPFRGYH